MTLAPNFSISYPLAKNFTPNGFELATSLNETGKTYFVVLSNNSPAPSPSQVKNGQDASGSNLAGNLFGSIDVTSANTEFSTSIGGLVNSTDYDVFIVAEDLVPNIQTSAVKLDVSTTAAGDVTPPMFSTGYPVIVAINGDGFTTRISLDEQGRTFFVVLPSGAASPTAAHVKDGQDGTGNVVAANFRGTINVTTASTEFSNPVSGLQPNTAYDVYFVSEDNVPNLQTTV
ncbi:MAG: hypothetical protein ACKOE6_08765, partial [Flammeovirgaceae bacterium]